jgi:HD-like signal output (HDOD) protein/CheY-like chemotaxis protein
MKRKILIVDDEPAVARLFQMALERDGYRVTTAANGFEGAAAAMRQKPDLILMDIEMPEMDGVAATRAIRENGGTRSIPVVVMTGIGTREVLLSAMAAGANDFLVKPDVRLETLLERVERALAPAPKARAPAPRQTPARPSAAPIGERIAAKLEKAMDLKALPFVAAEIIQVTASAESDATELAGTIERDAALTARVLRLANSTFYAAEGRAQNLTQAIAKLGFRAIREMALTVTLIEQYRGQGAEGGLDRLALWKHSLGCAVMARELAPAGRGEEAFLAGLLHDAGKAMLDDLFPREYAAVLAAARERRARLFEIEQEMLGTDHAMVARRLMDRWKLPGVLADPAGLHHAGWDALRAMADKDLKLVGAVRAANILAKAARVGSGGDDAIEEIPDDWCELLGLDVPKVRAAVGSLGARVGELTQILLLHDLSPEARAAAVAAPASARGEALWVRPAGARLDVTELALAGLGFVVRSAERIDGKPAAILVGPGPDDWVMERLDELERAEAASAAFLLEENVGRKATTRMRKARAEMLKRPYRVGEIGAALGVKS